MAVPAGTSGVRSRCHVGSQRRTRASALVRAGLHLRPLLWPDVRMRRIMMTLISRDDLLQKMSGGTPPALVEALGPAYFADAHLPGAINIPPDQVDRLASRLLPDLAGEVVVYC